jgi:hemerythrin
MDQLYDAASDELYAGSAREVAHDLFSYFDEHFTAEEALMQSAGYAGIEGHKQEHDSIIARVSAVLDDTKFNAMDLHWTLYQWLVQHVLNSDRKYAACVSEWLSKQSPGGGSVEDGQ